jgi:hypothetical protein
MERVVDPVRVGDVNDIERGMHHDRDLSASTWDMSRAEVIEQLRRLRSEPETPYSRTHERIKALEERKSALDAEQARLDRRLGERAHWKGDRHHLAVDGEALPFAAKGRVAEFHAASPEGRYLASVLLGRERLSDEWRTFLEDVLSEERRMVT